MSATVVVGKQGRIVVPSELRARLGLVAGERLTAFVEGDRLVLERTSRAVEELRGYTTPVSRGRSLVDELITERRAAAATE